MPINYVAPGPLQQIMSNSRSSGGGGGGITYGPDRTSQFQNELALAGLQGSIHAGIEREQIAGQLNQQQAHAESQAWLFNQEMTLKDQARLQQMKQAVSAVTADPTLTAEEKQRGITMLRSGIDPMDMRLKKQQMEALAQQRQAQAQDILEKTKLRDDTLAFKRAEMDGKLGYWVPPRYKMQISEMMKDAHPDVQPGTPEYDSLSTMLADEKGWAERYTKNNKGEMVFEKQVRGAGEGGGKAGSDELTANQHILHVESAKKMALNWAKAKQSAEGVMPPQEKIDEQYQKNLADLNGALSGYKDRKAGVPDKSKGPTEAEANLQSVQANEAIPPNQKMAVSFLYKKAGEMVKKYGPYEKMPSALKKRMDLLEQQIKAASQPPAIPVVGG